MIRGPSSRTLALIQRHLEAFLTERCSIEVQTTTRDEYGGYSDTWTLVADDVHCRIYPIPSREGAAAVAGSQETLVEVYRIVCPVGTGLDIDQRITVNNQVYHIVELIVQQTDGVDEQALMKRAV